MAQPYKKVGRGGAGNFYSKKDIEDVSKTVAPVLYPFFLPHPSLPLHSSQLRSQFFPTNSFDHLYYQRPTANTLPRRISKLKMMPLQSLYRKPSPHPNLPPETSTPAAVAQGTGFNLLNCNRKPSRRTIPQIPIPLPQTQHPRNPPKR